MSDLFISPFHPAHRKPDVVSPVTPSQAQSKELPIDSKKSTIVLETYDRLARVKEYRHAHMGTICYIVG